ncbi:MAG: hypothetical protein B0A82_26155 [Alkalinema sp. CACIAM 70d]|nr:MAG: hypothetical protein B0A82_26155 [Alkalinema sp. CACIAM 70d]
MKHTSFASTLSIFAVITSCLLTPNAQAVTFTPPANSNAPRQSTGGASRGAFKFVPPSNSSAPRQSTGGASRGQFFSSNGAPKVATGGASRGQFFSGKGAPRMATGGASRGQFFSGNGAPKVATGGASRGEFFSGNGAPTSASGGASRVGTYYLNPSIVGADGPAAIKALLPQSYFGTTISERPTILVYVPASSAQEAIFSLKDEAGNTQYQLTLPVSGQAGIMAVTLPSDAPALEVSKNYQWFLALDVDGQLSPSTPYVDGWVQRIQPTAELEAALQQTDALKRAEALGKAGVWYDCVTTLSSARSTQSNGETFNKQWTELLSSVGLKDIEKAPMLALAN